MMIRVSSMALAETVLKFSSFPARWTMKLSRERIGSLGPTLFSRVGGIDSKWDELYRFSRPDSTMYLNKNTKQNTVSQAFFWTLAQKLKGKKLKVLYKLKDILVLNSKDRRFHSRFSKTNSMIREKKLVQISISPGFLLVHFFGFNG